jgi:hypothetical protein
MNMEIPPEAQALADATWRALDLPGGEEILERMCDGRMSVPDGLAALAILSGEYERLPSADRP